MCFGACWGLQVQFVSHNCNQIHEKWNRCIMLNCKSVQKFKLNVTAWEVPGHSRTCSMIYDVEVCKLHATTIFCIYSIYRSFLLCIDVWLIWFDHLWSYHILWSFTGFRYQFCSLSCYNRLMIEKHLKVWSSIAVHWWLIYFLTHSYI